MQIKFNPDFPPSRANPTDAGLDLRADGEYNIVHGERTLVNTGVSAKIPVGYVGLLVPRSSLSKEGIMMTNSVGVIDADYRGPIMASLTSTRNCGSTIHKGDRIVQLLIVPIAVPELEVFEGTDEEWVDTARGLGGFGSTGKQ
jgi:dUTP pyrophosphatase